MNVFELPVNPAADVFPMLDDDELWELAGDIKANGLIEPIVLGPDPDGKTWLVDGRNRREACKLAGVEPETRMLNGEDQRKFIVSVNINRRHMMKGARAMAAAILDPESEQGKRTDLEVTSSETEEVDVPDGRLSEARTVLRHAGDLSDLVLGGALSLDAAYKEARKRKKAATSDEAKLARLKASHADLATLVVEGQLELAEAIAAAKARESEEKNARESIFLMFARIKGVPGLLRDKRVAKWCVENPKEFEKSAGVTLDEALDAIALIHAHSGEFQILIEEVRSEQDTTQASV